MLEQRLKHFLPKWAPTAVHRLHEGYDDLVCFFPGLSAGVLRAVFDSEYSDRHENVDRKVDYLARQNPYSGGREPWLPDSIADRYRGYEEEDRKRAEAERRAAGETLYRLAPDADPVLVEQGFWSGTPRDAETLEAAEARLKEFGFEKIREGQVVWWERKIGELVLYADPRTPGEISMTGYRLEAPKGKRGKPKCVVVLRETGIPDHWWRTDPAGKFAEWFSKQGLS